MRFAVLALPLLLAGCDVETRNPAQGDNKVSLNADASGNVAFDFPFAEGRIKLPAGMMENSDFDLDGVKLMPGAKMTGFRVDADNGPAKVDLSFTAPLPPAEARNYFVQQFEEKGVSAAAAGDSISGTSKDGTAFVIRFAGADGGTTNGTIELRPKEGFSE